MWMAVDFSPGVASNDGKATLNTVKIIGVQCCFGHSVLENIFCFMQKKEMHSGFERLSKRWNNLYHFIKQEKHSSVLLSERVCGIYYRPLRV